MGCDVSRCLPCLPRKRRPNNNRSVSIARMDSMARSYIEKSVKRGAAPSEDAQSEHSFRGYGDMMHKTHSQILPLGHLDISSSNPMYRPNIANSIVEAIGCTPCIRLVRLPRRYGVIADIVLKLESMEPCNSIKDRLGKGLIESAEERGEIHPGENIIVEPTSGNTGIGLAMVAASKGYQCIITMPESMSMERKLMLRALGARLVLTPAEKGVKGSIDKARDIVNNLNGRGIMFQQFNNPDNIKVHRETTGPEIWYQTDGRVDVVIGGIGTGGTVTGVSQCLKEHNPDVKVIGVEPSESAVLSGGTAGPHLIQGIGAGFIPLNCDMSFVDEVMTVSSEDAIECARLLAMDEGICCGISSGAAVACALREGSKLENEGKMIVVICADFGERYLSTALFDNIREELELMKAEP